MQELWDVLFQFKGEFKACSEMEFYVLKYFAIVVSTLY